MRFQQVMQSTSSCYEDQVLVILDMIIIWMCNVNNPKRYKELF